MADPTHGASRSSGRAGARLMALAGFVILVVSAVAARWTLAPRGSAVAPEPIPMRANAGAGEPVQDHPKIAFEPTDWALAPVAWIYCGIVVLLVVSAFVLIAAYPTALPDVGRTLRIAPPGPRLQTDPQGEMQRFRAAEEQRLHTYYWIDKQAGKVHIPIEEAMKKLATTGVAGFAKRQP